MKFKRIVAAICAAAMAFSPAGVNVLSFASFAETSTVETATDGTENDGDDENGGQSDGSDGSENDENGDQNDETASDTSDNDVTEETTDEYVAAAPVNASDLVYELNDGSSSDDYSTWSDVLAAMNDSTKDYTITLTDDATEGEITFPAATQANSVTVEGGGNTLTIANTALTLPTDVTFNNITLETTSASGLTITANKELSVLQLTSDTLKKVSGGSGSVLRFVDKENSLNQEYVNYEISGIGTVEVNDHVEFTNTVNAGKLVYGNDTTIYVGSNAVTFTSIEAGNGGNIVYTTEDFTPVTVSGDVTANDYIWLIRIDGYGEVKFANGATVLIAEKADISKFAVYGASRPTEDSELVRAGSEIKVMSVVYELSDGGDSTVKYSSWADVLAAMNDSTKDYTITFLADATEGNITFPAATQAKSVTVEGKWNTLTIDNASLTLPTDVTFKNLVLQTTNETGLTITANKNICANFYNSSDLNLKAVKGSSNSVFEVDGRNVNYDVSGFGTIAVTSGAYFNEGGETTTTVSATNLVLGNEEYAAEIVVGNCNATFTNIIVKSPNKNGEIDYEDAANIHPVTINGTVTAEKPIIIYADNGTFKNGDTVLISKTADLSKFELDKDSLPDNGVEYTLAREGSEVKIKGAVYELSDGGDSTVKYASWADAVAAMNDSTKDYTITLLGDVTEGNITFPKATQAKSVTVNGGYKTLTIDNSTLTFPTDVTFSNDLRLETTSASGLTITANKNFVAGCVSGTLKTVKGSSNSILTLSSRNVNYNISGFETIVAISYVNFGINGETAITVSAENLEIDNERSQSIIKVDNCNATFTNIIVKSSKYPSAIGCTANINPVTINGTVTAEKPIQIVSYGGKFKSGDTVLISKTADLSKFVLYESSLPEDGVEYTLAREGSEVKVKGAVFELSDGGDSTVKYSSWTEVLAAIKDKTKDYTITLLSDVTEGKITFPAATKAKSVTVNGGGHTFTIDNTALTLPTDVKFYNITLESSDKTKGLTITANKNFVDGYITSTTLKTVKGSSKSILTFDFESKDITYSISGFGTVVSTLAVGFNLDGETATTVEAANLVLQGYDGEVIIVGNCNARFTNVKVINSNKSCRIRYEDAEDFTPVTITGTVTTEKPIIISASNNKFKNGDTVLISKTADLSKFVIDENSIPDDGIEYTLAKVGSEVKVMGAVFELKIGTGEPVNFAQWSDILNTIAENAKADKDAAKTTNYIVKVLGDVNVGKFTMPKAGTFGTLRITGGSEDAKALTFTGTAVSLTGDTFLHNLILKAEKTAGSGNYVDFSISAGKNFFELNNVTGKIKDIKSTGTVALGGTTINGNVSANELYINNGTEPTIPGIQAAPKAFEPQAIDKTSVTVNGNLTVKNMLYLDGSLTVKGAFSAAGIINRADEDEIALVLTQNTKKPAVIGKLGFDSESAHIKFALVDPTTGKTVQIVEDTVIASISGPYADQLVPCDENLDSDESYYIVKENGKLVAKSTATSFVEVIVNGNTARYASLDEAIKDINATGSKDDKVEFKITQAMFSEPIAKLPLPNAGKYGELSYTADADVTIKVTSDLALTGNLAIVNDITINKVDKSGNVVPISVNVGKYNMLAYCLLSPDTVGDKTVNRIVNISGAGTFAATDDVVVTGKVNVGELEFLGNTVTLEGTKSSFTGSVFVHNAGGTLVYDKANAKNVKFSDVSGYGSLTVKIDGVEAGDAIAAITGDYTVEMIEIYGSELVVARSDKNLVAVSEASGCIVVIERENDEPKAYRPYDTLENAMKDINRLNNKNSDYLVLVADAADKTYSKLPLPNAGKYNDIMIKGNGKAVINVSSDITLTGDLYVQSNVTINKVDKKGNVVEMSVNVGNYNFDCNGKLSYDTTKSVNQLKNVSGKGTFAINGIANVSGKVNVGKISWRGIIKLGEKAGFAANVQTIDNLTTLMYPVAVGKNVKLGAITYGISTNPGQLKVQIDGVKAGDQIAALTGDYIAGTVVINDGAFTAVRSGTKLLAVANGTEVTVSDGTNDRAYDTYENAVADITRLANAEGEYTIRLPEGKYEWAKLALPAKGKYKSVTLVSSDEGDAEISVKSDVTLSGNLVIGFGVTLQKVKTFGGDPVSPFKFTSTKNKDGSPVYTVTVLQGGKIVNGTLNGNEILNPAEPEPE